MRLLPIFCLTFVTRHIYLIIYIQTQTLTAMADNKYISVNYELFAECEGETPVLVEKTSKDNSFDFVTGLGYTLPAFEEQVAGLAVGDKFDFAIPCEQAYGAYDESRVKTLSKEIFRGGNGHFDAETIYPGNVIPMVNEDGMRFDGLVKEVTADSVVVDFNHELAGMDLRFRGEIAESHEASAEEISAFVNRMSGGCGCGDECGDHGGGCHCDHDHEGGHCGEGHCGCGHCH
jgi:FKBP-type peptidyl-prolyl cis-trans isomerase SlyD